VDNIQFQMLSEPGKQRNYAHARHNLLSDMEADFKNPQHVQVTTDSIPRNPRLAAHFHSLVGREAGY
jgi:hypothetical protein